MASAPLVAASQARPCGRPGVWRVGLTGELEASSAPGGSRMGVVTSRRDQDPFRCAIAMVALMQLLLVRRTFVRAGRKGKGQYGRKPRGHL